MVGKVCGRGRLEPEVKEGLYMVTGSYAMWFTAGGAIREPQNP